MLIPTAAAKGNVSDEHPQSLGSTLPLTATQELLAAADVVLAVGTELAETDHWTDRLPIKGKLIRIDVDPRTLMRDYKPDVAILADAGAALTALNQKIATRPADIERIAKVRAANAGVCRSLAKKHAKVLDALREVLPDDGIVVSDMTQIAYTGATSSPAGARGAGFIPRASARWAMPCPRPSAPSSPPPSAPWWPWRAMPAFSSPCRSSRPPWSSSCRCPSCSGTTTPSARSPAT